VSKRQHSKGKKRPRGWHNRGFKGNGQRVWRILSRLEREGQ
jgi:hypothetical protein